MVQKQRPYLFNFLKTCLSFSMFLLSRLQYDSFQVIILDEVEKNFLFLRILHKNPKGRLSFDISLKSQMMCWLIQATLNMAPLPFFSWVKSSNLFMADGQST